MTDPNSLRPITGLWNKIHGSKEEDDEDKGEIPKSLQERNATAFGGFVSTATKTLTSEQLETVLTADPYSETFKELEEQHEAVSKQLTDDEQKLLNELLSIFDDNSEEIFDDDGDGCKSTANHASETKKVQVETEKHQVRRAQKIIENIKLNVNFNALPYGQTFLGSSVHRDSADMLKMLVDKGADVNNEDTMDGATALDSILEFEEERELSTEEHTMKILLLSKGAKTYEERMNDEMTNLRSEHEEEEDY